MINPTLYWVPALLLTIHNGNSSISEPTHQGSQVLRPTIAVVAQADPDNGSSDGDDDEGDTSNMCFKFGGRK